MGRRTTSVAASRRLDKASASRQYALTEGWESAVTEPTQAGVPGWRLYRVPEAMQLLSMSRTISYEQIRAGRLRSVTQGRTRLIPANAIADYVALLVDESADDALPDQQRRRKARF